MLLSSVCFNVRVQTKLVSRAFERDNTNINDNHNTVTGKVVYYIKLINEALIMRCHLFQYLYHKIHLNRLFSRLTQQKC